MEKPDNLPAIPQADETDWKAAAQQMGIRMFEAERRQRDDDRRRDDWLRESRARLAVAMIGVRRVDLMAAVALPGGFQGHARSVPQNTKGESLSALARVERIFTEAY